MSFSTFSGTHGGIGYFARTLRALLSGGWTASRYSFDRPDWGAQPSTQSNTLPVDVDLSGFVLPIAISLPVMFLVSPVVKKNFVTTPTAGVDYSLNNDTGVATILPGGIFDNGSGFGTGRFTIDRGYSIRQGWAILSSTGGTGTEQHKIGLRFVGAAAVPASPVLTGIEFSLWDAIPADGESYTIANLTKRSKPAHDVLNLIEPNLDYSGMASLTVDRLVTYARCGDLPGSWAFCGGLRRFRPFAEQRLTLCALGSTPTLSDRAGGPVAKTNEPGDLSSALNMGSLWDMSLSRFVDAENVSLNANHWTREAGSLVAGYTPSSRETVAGSVSTMPTMYAETHVVIPGRNISTVGASTNILFGLAEGVHTVLFSGPSHNAVFTMDGRTISLAHIGARRFVGIEQI